MKMGKMLSNKWDSNKNTSTTSSSSVKELEQRITQLEDQNGELKLYVATIFQTLMHKGVLDYEEFKQFKQEIDALDGVVDGKYMGEL